MTADTARFISDKHGNTLENVLREIKDAATNGDRHIDVFSITPSLETQLKNLGYDISCYPNRITLFVRVSW